MKTWILVPLANDAEKNEALRKYIGIDQYSRQRIQEALQWVEEKIPTAEKAWVFGAGTHASWRNGRTLGSWSEVYLRTLLHNPVSVFTNHADHKFYGLHEEMKWGIKAVQKYHRPGAAVFVFFGPRWQLLQAQLIWRLFFKREWGKARFVETTDGAVPRWGRECLGYVKIVGHRFIPRFVKTRDQKPYRSVKLR